MAEEGEGELEPERDTDFDPSLAKKRYLVFKVGVLNFCSYFSWLGYDQSIASPLHIRDPVSLSSLIS